MEELKRVRKVLNWLIFKEIAVSETDIAAKLGYKKSSFSQIVNGKVPLSEKFVNKLCLLDENINSVWILTGEGDMFVNDNLNSEIVPIPMSAWSVIQRQAESLSARDRQIDELIVMLREQVEENKKINARQVNVAKCADAG